MKLLAGLAALWSAVLAWAGLYHPYGLRFALGIWPVPQGTPWTYQLESGFIPALTVLTLLSAVFSLYHVHNCHYDGCWRIGKHRVNGTPWCSVHEQQARPARTEAEILTSIEGMLGELLDIARAGAAGTAP